MSRNRFTSNGLPHTVKERLQFTPDLPAKQKMAGKEWVDAEKVRKNMSDVRAVNNNPQRDSVDTAAMKSRANENMDYDRTYNKPAVKDGYLLHKVGPTENNYTDEHNEHFYEEITSEEGVTGFLERNNFLDRI